MSLNSAFKCANFANKINCDCKLCCAVDGAKIIIFKEEDSDTDFDSDTESESESDTESEVESEKSVVMSDQDDEEKDKTEQQIKEWMENEENGSEDDF
jgi:hypothetical protein